MQDLKKLVEELRRGEQAERLKTLAASADGQKLGGMLGGTALAEAARNGDAEAMRALLERAMASAEGQRLSRELEKLFRGQGHG